MRKQKKADGERAGGVAVGAALPKRRPQRTPFKPANVLLDYEFRFADRTGFFKWMYQEQLHAFNTM